MKVERFQAVLQEIPEEKAIRWIFPKGVNIETGDVLEFNSETGEGTIKRKYEKRKNHAVNKV